MLFRPHLLFFFGDKLSLHSGHKLNGPFVWFFFAIDLLGFMTIDCQHTIFIGLYRNPFLSN